MFGEAKIEQSMDKEIEKDRDRKQQQVSHMAELMDKNRQ
jgi:hypothetical protein